MHHITKSIALVTGANSGIGKEVTISLVMQDIHVLMISRNINRGKTALNQIKQLTGKDNITLLICDLSSQAAINQLATKLNKGYPRLDVLINNAGVVLKEKCYSEDNIEMTLATNHLGPFLLTERLLPLLQKSQHARIINVSSAIHHVGKIDTSDMQFDKRPYRFMSAYAQSKLLLNLMTFQMAKRLSNTNIRINAIHPGAVKTHIGTDSANTYFLRAMDKLIKFFCLSPEKAAKPIVELATSAEYQHINGQYFTKGKARKANKRCYEESLQNQIRDFSSKMVGLS